MSSSSVAQSERGGQVAPRAERQGIALSVRARAELREALQAVVDHAMDAYGADDLDTIKRGLDETWHAVRYARETVCLAERETRAAAIRDAERKVA